MKAFDEYFLMVVLTLLLNRVHVFTICSSQFNLNRETWHGKVKDLLHRKSLRMNVLFQFIRTESDLRSCEARKEKP